MNRYPLWRYLVIGFALVASVMYTLPNFFGEVPAVQISSLKATARVDTTLMEMVEKTLKANSIQLDGMFTDPNSIKVRFRDTDTQLKAKDVLDQALNPNRESPSFILALNLISDSPAWFTAINALPMYLGLDLR
ncbi:MAG: protein translocase subunit SecD, partial [Burkholderiales bacterium]|nr:protein translocase subunit SecD [Burkholderiales bacterium]